MKNTNVISFSKDKIQRILELSRRSIDRDKYVINLETGEKDRCFECEREIKVEEVGAVMPGSDVLICDNPTCFAKYADEKNLV